MYMYMFVPVLVIVHTVGYRRNGENEENTSQLWRQISTVFLNSHLRHELHLLERSIQLFVNDVTQLLDQLVRSHGDSKTYFLT